MGERNRARRNVTSGISNTLQESECGRPGELQANIAIKRHLQTVCGNPTKEIGNRAG